MAHLVNPQGHRTAIIGITGSGKTFWALELFHRLPPETMAIYIDYAAVVRRESWAQHLRPLLITDRRQLLPCLKENRKAVFQPRGNADVEMLAGWMLAWKGSIPNPAPLWIFFDEIHNYGREWDAPNVGKVFTMGRNFNITGIAITQNLPAIRNTSIIINCQVKVTFSLDSAGVRALSRNYQTIVPDNVLEWVNQQAHLRPPERKIYNAAVYGLTGPEWRMI